MSQLGLFVRCAEGYGADVMTPQVGTSPRRVWVPSYASCDGEGCAA